MFTVPLNLQLQPRLEFRFAVALLPSCGVIRYYRKSPNLSNYREDWLNPRHRSRTPPPPPIFSSCFFFLSILLRTAVKWSRAKTCGFTPSEARDFFRSANVSSVILACTPAMRDKWRQAAPWRSMVKVRSLQGGLRWQVLGDLVV